MLGRDCVERFEDGYLEWSGGYIFRVIKWIYWCLCSLISFSLHMLSSMSKEEIVENARDCWLDLVYVYDINIFSLMSTYYYRCRQCLACSEKMISIVQVICWGSFAVILDNISDMFLVDSSQPTEIHITIWVIYDWFISCISVFHLFRIVKDWASASVWIILVDSVSAKLVVMLGFIVVSSTGGVHDSKFDKLYF